MSESSNNLVKDEYEWWHVPVLQLRVAPSAASDHHTEKRKRRVITWCIYHFQYKSGFKLQHD